jgi:signal transduction histidine kinase
LENLLQWSRSQLNGVKSEPELIDIRKPIQEMSDLFKIQLAEKNLTLKYYFSNRFAVYIDKHHLNLLFRNLLSNAIKYSNDGGKIEINATNLDSNFTLIEIIDGGIGMNQEAIDKVFSATEHYSTYGTKNERGTGLGLLLCKEYAENSGGRIWIESVEGQGAKISVVLPNSGQ